MDIGDLAVEEIPHEEGARQPDPAEGFRASNRLRRSHRSLPGCRPWRNSRGGSFYGIRPFGEGLGVVALRPDQPGERTSGILARSQPVDDELEIVARLPAELVARPLVDVHGVDAWTHLPATVRVFRSVVGNATGRRQRGIRAQVHQVLA